MKPNTLYIVIHEYSSLQNNQTTAAESTVDAARSSPGSVSSQETANEAPSSSTTTTTGINSQNAEDIANGYRSELALYCMRVLESGIVKIARLRCFSGILSISKYEKDHAFQF